MVLAVMNVKKLRVLNGRKLKTLNRILELTVSEESIKNIIAGIINIKILRFTIRMLSLLVLKIR